MSGVIRKPISYGLGTYDEIIYYPLESAQDISDLDRIRWPKIEWWDFSYVKKDIEKLMKRKSMQYVLEMEIYLKPLGI